MRLNVRVTEKDYEQGTLTASSVKLNVLVSVMGVEPQTKNL